MSGTYFLLSNIERMLRDQNPLPGLVANRLGLGADRIRDVVILREALDARKKDRIHHVYTLAVRLDDDSIPVGCKECIFPELNFDAGDFQPVDRPIIVGLGPAGMFCALALARKGYRPLILEQGKPAGDRLGDVRAIAEAGVLDEYSNVLFGEGGAGTFSDGKLTARNQSAETDFFHRTLIAFGADPRIGYQAKPHLGSDQLRRIIPAITGYLVAQGVEIRYGWNVSGIRRGAGGRVAVLSDKGECSSDCVILAVGHSADMLYKSLFDAGVAMEKKPFAVGVRVEHPRAFIDEWQYGKGFDTALTGPADYKLTANMDDGRGVYSFCVCPGGEIINASSRPGHVCVNGMSWSSRGGIFTNGAIVVTVLPSDLPDHPLAGLEFRDRMEKACHAAGPLLAPAQDLKDFMAGRKGKAHKSSYRPGTFDADLNALLPEFIVNGLKFGFARFDRQIRGFIQNGVLVAPETGTSSPVRILRDAATFQSINMPGVFPIGEGAGYAGGIVSSAADGIRLALRFKRR
jgi:hypothetical protein